MTGAVAWGREARGTERSPRRWIALGNPELAALLTRTIGEGWISDLEAQLARIEPHASDAGFRAEWRAVQLWW